MNKDKLTREVNREVRHRADLFKKHMREPGPKLFFVLPGVKSEIRGGYCLTRDEKPVSRRFESRYELYATAGGIALKERYKTP